MSISRRYPIGAEIIPEKGVHFRIWAADHHEAFILIKNKGQLIKHQMENEKNGYFSLLISDYPKEALYFFQFEDSSKQLSDPASRYQPEGPIGGSMVIENQFPWTDQQWKGISEEPQVIYEMHIGTFTKEGTFHSAAQQLESLADLGITIIEIMPINDYPGSFGWGYDGVNLYAPCRLYGHPNDVKAFIDKAHRLRINVILDVVYNHFGPEENQVREFTKQYFDKNKNTEWGEAINFDHPSCREFFINNVKYWIEEFHFDGLRFDATPWLFSSTPVHILEDLTKAAYSVAGNKKLILIAENEPQHSRLVESYEEGGYGFNAMWNDDFHHTARVRLTGEREAYYTDYLGTPQEFISCMKFGFLYQGQYYSWQKKGRGTPKLDMPSHGMVIFLENHDQIANTGRGLRLLEFCDHGNYKALLFLLLLSPNIPMIFQGQEFGSSKPFYYFADHSKKLNLQIKRGRKQFLSQFPRLANEGDKIVEDPGDRTTFEQCILDFSEREKNQSMFQLHKDLIALRRGDPVFSNMHKGKIDGAVINHDAFLIRYFGGEAGDRLLIINFGADFLFTPAPEPLIAPCKNSNWELLLSSESIAYQGEGVAPLTNKHLLKIIGHSALVLKSKEIKGTQ